MPVSDPQYAQRSIRPIDMMTDSIRQMANAGPLFSPVEGTELDGSAIEPPTDDAEVRGLGPEDGTGQIAGGPAGNVITFNLTGTAAAPGLLWDQWWLFSLLADQPVNATYAMGTVDIITEDGVWTPALVSMYVGLEPLFIVNLNLVGFNNPAAVSGFTARIRSSDPFGNTSGNMQPVAAYQNAADFRNDRGQLPNAQPLNGWTWLRMVAPIQVAPTTGTVSAFFGPRQSNMAIVPRVAPQIVRTVNR